MSVKHENHQPIGAFKVRGGVNLVAQLGDDERTRGLISASTGNHGQSIAYAARLFGVRAVICVPEGANPVKVAGIESLGAEILVHGRELRRGAGAVRGAGPGEGVPLCPFGNEPDLIVGVATGALEIVEDEPATRDDLRPYRRGGAGPPGRASSPRPSTRRSAYRGAACPRRPPIDRKEGRPVVDRMETYAEGLATRTAFELPQQILRRHLDDFVLVSDDQILAAQATLLTVTKNLVEAAGAAAFAGACRLPRRTRRQAGSDRDEWRQRQRPRTLRSPRLGYTETT